MQALITRERAQRHKLRTLRTLLYGAVANQAPEEIADQVAATMCQLGQASDARRKAEVAVEDGVLLETSSDDAGQGDRDAAGFELTVKLRMDRIPTGVAHLLAASDDPLVTYELRNPRGEPARLRLTSYVEGYSARAVKTVTLGADPAPVVVHQSPTFFPSQLAAISELTMATLHVLVERLDRNDVEYHETYALPLLSRNSACLSIDDPATGRCIDLTARFGAWVTPNDPVILEVLREAATLAPNGAITGYHAENCQHIEAQVRAIFEVLRVRRIAYVESITSFGAGPGESYQRIRLPREAIASRSANCLDGAVLIASLLEAACINPALVLMPGHALVAWESAPGTNDWDYIETTMIASGDFDRARALARHQVRVIESDYKAYFRVLPVAMMREQGITPME